MNIRQRNIILLIIFAFLVARYAYTTATKPDLIPAAPVNENIQEAYRRQLSAVQIEGSGTIVKTLADDSEGSRHQRFLITVAPDHTVLIVHNIDIATRINGLKPGDQVAFFGEYEWNDQGGLVHWTHHDPQRKHVDGWLRYRGRTYQ